MLINAMKKLKVMEIEWENEERGNIWEGFWKDGLYVETLIFRRKSASENMKKKKEATWVWIPHAVGSASRRFSQR